MGKLFLMFVIVIIFLIISISCTIQHTCSYMQNLLNPTTFVNNISHGTRYIECIFTVNTFWQEPLQDVLKYQGVPSLAAYFETMRTNHAYSYRGSGYFLWISPPPFRFHILGYSSIWTYGSPLSPLPRV